MRCRADGPRPPACYRSDARRGWCRESRTLPPDGRADILEKTARENKYVDSSKPIIVVAREVLNGNGIATIVLKTKCVIRDDRAEQAFQTDFIFQVNKVLKENLCLQL